MTPASILNFTPDQISAAFLSPDKITPPYPWVQHIPFAFSLMRALKPKQFVELGVHTGNSYFAFCQAVAEGNTGTKCYGVDTWQGDPHASFYDPNIFSKVEDYNRTKYEAFSSLLRMSFDEGLSYFSEGSIDLLHIDGYHTYEAVKHDFTTWLPKMSSQGVILFHDTTVKQHEFGVWKFFEEISKKFPAFTFYHGHGLGVVCVGKSAPDAIAPLFRDIDQQNLAREFFSHIGQALLLNIMYGSTGRKSELQERFEHVFLPESFQAQISLDTGEGFTEAQTWRTDVSLHSQVIDFYPPAISNVKAARVYCFNGPHSVEVHSIVGTYADSADQVPLSYTMHTDHIVGEKAIFLDYTRGITLNIDPHRKLSSVRIEVTFSAFGARTFEILASSIGNQIETQRALSAQLQIRTHERDTAVAAIAQFEFSQKDMLRKQDHIQHLEALLKSAQEEKERYRADIENILHSKSWKITAPLRGLIHNFKS